MCEDNEVAISSFLPRHVIEQMLDEKMEEERLARIEEDDGV